VSRLRTPYGTDAVLLLVRLLLGTIMIAHGHKKLFVDGIGRTTDGFEHLSIPVAIVSASFVTVVELVGGTLLVLGLLTRVVAGLMGFVMAGAAFFVHGAHGVFVTDGGWELVGAIGAALAGLAVAGPGRLGVAHLVDVVRTRTAAAAVADPAPPPVFEPDPEPIPPAGLPLVPVIRITPSPVPRLAQPLPARHRASPPVG
jgi:putative oxidoreductase